MNDGGDAAENVYSGPPARRGAVRDSHGEVSTQARDAGPRHGRPARETRQLVVAHRPQVPHERAVQRRPRLPGGIVAPGGRLVPRADVLADVAAEDAGADRGPERVRNLTPQLDREIGQAPPRVEHVRFDDGAGRTCLDAERAGSAAVEDGFVGCERQAAGDDGEEEPGTEIGVDQAAVLPDPPEARALGVRPLVNRPGVHDMRAPRMAPRARRASSPAGCPAARRRPRGSRRPRRSAKRGPRRDRSLRPSTGGRCCRRCR